MPRKTAAVKKTARGTAGRKAKLARAAGGKPVRRPLAGKKTVVRSARIKPPSRSEQKVVGRVIHYFPKVRAAVVRVSAPVSLGDRIKVRGHTTEFSQNISSMEIDHVALRKAKKGDVIGLLVESRVRRHDVVLKA